MKPLVLASSSPYRAELLTRLGLPFARRTPAIDESRRPGETPEALVRRLAGEKAAAVAQGLPAAPAALVIGSDQLAVCDGDVLGKPGSDSRAREQLARLSGRAVTFLTSLCLLDTGTGARQLAVVPTVVCFRPLSPAEIERYVERERPLDCAGAFKSEGLGVTLFESLESRDPTALVGLPLIELCSMLRRVGLDPLLTVEGRPGR